jgi:hypothetical protein
VDRGDGFVCRHAERSIPKSSRQGAIVGMRIGSIPHPAVLVVGGRSTVISIEDRSRLGRILQRVPRSGC